MAILPIRLLGDPALRKKAQAVNKITNEERELVRDMMETMEVAEGIGLAANQVGVLKRIIVFRMGEKVRGLINPRIVRRGGEQQVGPEGCLSLPRTQGEVRRSTKVVVSGRNAQGKQVRYACEEMAARCVQHEIDHLDGVLYTDRMEPDTLSWIVWEKNPETGEEESKLIPTTLEDVRQVFAKQGTLAYKPKPKEGTKG